MGVTQINPTILLIDDAELDTKIFKLVIRKVLLNANIETCENGKLAIEKLKKLNGIEPGRLPDYIFLDLRMPVMDGWGFLQKYSALKIDPLHKSKIYILSSSIDYKDVEKSLFNPHVKELISKPIDMSKLKVIFS